MSLFPRALVAALSLLLVSSVGPVVAAAPAHAAVTYLCKGYAGCQAQGMGNAGYASASSTMWWRMYAGHNCTNYVAYRMVKSGMPNVRPWSGSGNAMYWGESMSRITNSVPAVGAVAWWKQNVTPAGSAGHVAYVEKVVSADEIIVSQDFWGGDFSWARITRTGGGWPSGFIHFNDVPLVNTTLPTTTGEAKVGSVLTATPGSWSPSDVTVAYQWRVDGVDILDATSSTLKLRRAWEGKRISVRTTASKVGHAAVVAYSTDTLPVEPGEITNLVAPAVSGEPKVDEPLTATAGEWKPAPGSVSLQWTADGAPISGATTATFTPGPDEVGKAIAVIATATKAGYLDVPVTSAPTAPVAKGTIVVAEQPALEGTPRYGETLALSSARLSSTNVQTSVEWLRSGQVVPDATRSSYSLSAEDLGSRIAARITLMKPGYETVVLKARRSRVIKTVPQVSAATTRVNRRVSVALAVTAPGLSTVKGTVLVKDGRTILKEVTLRRGERNFTIRGLAAGRHQLRFIFRPTETVARGVQKRTVRIP